MKQMKHLINTIVLIEILLYSLIINGRTICPTGKPVTKENCARGDSCPEHSICYRDNGERFCCGDLDMFCPLKMHTFYGEDDYESNLWGKTEIEKYEPEWYNVTLGNDTIGCPIPYSITYFDVLKLVPIGFDATKLEISYIKTCDKNSDCDIDNEEFCDTVFNASFEEYFFLDKSGPNRTTFKYCYKFQNNGSDKVKPIIKADEMSLWVCNNNSDCFESHGFESFCLEIKNPLHPGKLQVRTPASIRPTFYKGVCAIANVCDRKRHESNVASLSKTNYYCITDQDCQGNSISKKYPHLAPECVAIENLTYAGNMCCFKHNTVCEVGEIIFPLKKCSRFEDCNGNGTLKNQWCDEKGGHCCRDDTNRWACKDGVTPLFNESKCYEYISWDINSGTCPQVAGICRYGYCCPPSRLNNANETVMGQKPYITNVACNPEESVPPQFKYAFCHPEKKIVIMGEKDVNGDATINEGTECQSNKNCTEGHFCVSGINGEHHCFLNPLILKKQESADSQLWKYGMIAGIVFGVPFLIVSIIYFLCHMEMKKMQSTATTPIMTTKT